jgi:hypothetical protein
MHRTLFWCILEEGKESVQMRKIIANAMLCLLLLLSVATARCESLCAMSSMPATSSASTNMQHDDAMAMDSDMEHCHGMHAMQNDLPNADAGCGQMNCRHQALPASSDVRVVADDTASLAAVVLPIVEHTVLPLQRLDDAADPPHIVPLTPLEQSSMLRV